MARARTINDVDWQLFISADRIARYKARGDVRSVMIERRVCDRLLDERNDLMAALVARQS